MPTDFRTAISNFLADQGNQQMLQRMGTGAAIGAGGMALNDLLQGGEEDETTGDRAGSLGRSMLLGGAMGGLGGLGYDQLNKHFLNDPSKTPGGAQVFSKPGQLWHSLRQSMPNSGGMAALGAIGGAGREAWRQKRIPDVADKLFGSPGAKIDEKSVRKFLDRTGGWSQGTVNALASELTGQSAPPTNVAGIKSLLGNSLADSTMAGTAWQGAKNTANNLFGHAVDRFKSSYSGAGQGLTGKAWQGIKDTGSAMKNSLKGLVAPARAGAYRPLSQQVDVVPGWTSTKLGPNGMPMNPVVSKFKDLLTHVPGATKFSPGLSAHQQAPELVRVGTSPAGNPTARAEALLKAMQQPGSYSRLGAIGGGALRGAGWTLAASEALKALGRHSFDQLAMTPEAAAELARNPRFRQQ